MLAINKIERSSNLLFFQFLSIATYFGSLWFQDRLLKTDPTIADLLSLLNLFATTLVCARGYACLKKGVRTNMYLVALSVLVVISIKMTNQGQLAAGVMARLLFKSTKVIPTLTFESLSSGVWPARLKLAGSCLLSVGCAVYYASTIKWKDAHLQEERESHYVVGVLFLISSAFIDSTLTVLEKRLFLVPNATCALTASQLTFGCAWWGFLALGLSLQFEIPEMDFDFSLSTQHYHFLLEVLLFCTCSAVAYSMNFYFIDQFGPLYADSFKLFRKVASMVAFGVITGASLSHSAIFAFSICSLGIWLVEFH